MTLAELRAAWTHRRDEWRKLGVQVDGAKLADEILAELEQLETPDADTVSLAEASVITGRTPDHLGRMIRRGQLPNVGRKHAPRIPRAALERLGRKVTAPDPADASPAALQLASGSGQPYNPAADARSLLRRRARGGSHGAQE
jgi:hypothetical protein